MDVVISFESPVWEPDMADDVGALPPDFPERMPDEGVLARFFEHAEEQQYALNRTAARRAAGVAEALRFAREHPWVFVHLPDAEAASKAERCAVLEASLRLVMSESEVRALDHVASAAQEWLPLLWWRAEQGFASLAQVDAAVRMLSRFEAFGPAPARQELAAFDRALADIVMDAPVAAFRAKARLLAIRLAPMSREQAHAVAFADRRVVVEPADDGMSWISAYLSTVDALAIKRRLTSTAKHLHKRDRDGRSRDQVRADLFAAWLRGAGTPTAVSTKVFVTVPLDRLSRAARATVRTDAGSPSGLDLNAGPRLLGDDDPLDADTARRLLLEAGAFTRVITDPVSGVVLDMDRRARTVTRAQREWLLLTHAACTRDGCRRAAADAEIDHWQPFHGPGRGPTDLSNLHPLCPGDHRLKDATRLRFRRRADRSVQVASPTGFRSAAPRRPTVDALPDAPPF